MHLASIRTAFPWVARGLSVAVLALAVLLLLLLVPPHPLPWLSAGLALAVPGATILAATRRRSPGASAPGTAFVGS